MIDSNAHLTALALATPRANIASAPDNSKTFRSAWLCSRVLSDTIRPVMDRMVFIEARDNNNRTNSFLPHVTLFSGNELSTRDCEGIMQVFFDCYPRGITLSVDGYHETPSKNPPVQLTFRPTTQWDGELLAGFQDAVEKKLGKTIIVNHHWLHATLLYKNVPQDLAEGTVLEARAVAQALVGRQVHFNQYAFNTGRAYNPQDVAQWAGIRAKSFASTR